MEPLVVTAFIEIPAGSQNKYEYDKDKGIFFLDRVLFSPMHYPTDYGFVPETLEEDGDPIDILVLGTEPTFPGCHIKARVVGALAMVDDKGVDNKLLSVTVKDPRFDEIRTLEDVPMHIRREVEHFFKTYKELEGKATIMLGWNGAEEAARMLDKARVAYQAR